MSRRPFKMLRLTPYLGREYSNLHLCFAQKLFSRSRFFPSHPSPCPSPSGCEFQLKIVIFNFKGLFQCKIFRRICFSYLQGSSSCVCVIPNSTLKLKITVFHLLIHLLGVIPFSILLCLGFQLLCHPHISETTDVYFKDMR